MSALASALFAELDDDALDALAELLEPRLVARLSVNGSASPWLNARQAAEYIAAPVSRIHDLVQLQKLTPRRDGRRLLFTRADLDDYLKASA